MRRIFLIDCPGVVYPSGDNEADIVLKGKVNLGSLLSFFIHPFGSTKLGMLSLKKLMLRHLRQVLCFGIIIVPFYYPCTLLFD